MKSRKKVKVRLSQRFKSIIQTNKSTTRAPAIHSNQASSQTKLKTIESCSTQRTPASRPASQATGPLLVDSRPATRVITHSIKPLPPILDPSDRVLLVGEGQSLLESMVSRLSSHPRVPSRNPSRCTKPHIPPATCHLSSSSPHSHHQPTLTIIVSYPPGNLSFSVSLLLEHSHPGYLITASTLDSKQTVSEKYPESIESIKILEDHQVRLIFELDGSKLDQDKRIKEIVRRDGPFDRIIFNFPHVGGSESDQARIIRANQSLILRFLRSTFTLLSRTTHPPDHHHQLQSSIDPSHLPDRTNKRPLLEVKKRSRRNKKPRTEDQEDSPSDDDHRHPHHHQLLDSHHHSSSSSSSHSEDDRHPPPPRSRKPGTVLITTGTDSPYSLWDVPALAKNGRLLAHTILYPNYPSLRSKGEQPNYRLVRSFDFDRWISTPDRLDDHHRSRSVYRHRQTNGFKNLNKDTRPSHPRTWEFQPLDP